MSLVKSILLVCCCFLFIYPSHPFLLLYFYNIIFLIFSYSFHTIFCSFLSYSIVIRHLHTLRSDHPSMSSARLTPRLVMAGLLTVSPGGFQSNSLCLLEIGVIRTPNLMGLSDCHLATCFPFVPPVFRSSSPFIFWKNQVSFLLSYFFSSVALPLDLRPRSDVWHFH